MQEGTVTSELREDKLLEHTQITASVDRTNINGNVETGAENQESSTNNMFLSSLCLRFTKEYLRTKHKKNIYLYKLINTRNPKLCINNKATGPEKSAERQIVINGR